MTEGYLNQDPFSDIRFIRAVERWMRIRLKPIKLERDFVFCACMNLCFDDIECVYHYLNTGYKYGRVEREFRRAQMKFHEKGVNQV